MTKIIVFFALFLSFLTESCEQEHDLIKHINLSKTIISGMYELKIEYPSTLNGNSLIEARFFLKGDVNLIIVPVRSSPSPDGGLLSYITIDKESYLESGVTFYYGAEGGVIPCGAFISYRFNDIE